MKVKDLTIKATTVSSRQGGLDNAKVYVDGAQVGSTKDLTEATGVTTWGFGSSFVVKAGATAKVKILADIKTTTSTSYADSNTVLVSVASTASDIQKMSSLGYQAAISAVNGTAAALTITAAALTVARASDLANQTIIAGSNNVRLGSFVLTAGSSEGINLSSITVTLSANESATVTNMYLKDRSGAVLGSAKNVPGQSNIYSLSPNIALAAGTSKTIDLYADVKAASNAGIWQAQIDASGSGVTTGSSVSSTAALQAIQSMTVAGAGTLTVTNGSMPDPAIVLAGSTGNYVAVYNFRATNEGFLVDELAFKMAKAFATSTANVTIKYTDKPTTANPAGTLRTATGQFIADDVMTNATATFTGLTMYVPANTDRSVKVYVDMGDLNNVGVTASGATGAMILDYNNGFNATGDSGTALTTPTSSTADFTGNSFYDRKSKPTFAKQALTGAPSTGNALYKFTVVADNAGEIDIKQLGFTVTTNGCDIDALYLYDTNANVQLTDSTVAVIGANQNVGGSYQLIVGRTSPASGTGDVSDDDVLTISSSDSPVKTYEVRGTITNFTSSASDSITVKFKTDAAATTTSAVSTMIVQGAYNIWSDKSAASHSTTSADWTNGYLLKGMGDVQQLQ